MNRNLLRTVHAINHVRQTISDLREEDLPPEELSPEHLEEIDVILIWALARCEATPGYEPTASQIAERLHQE